MENRASSSLFCFLTPLSNQSPSPNIPLWFLTSTHFSPTFYFSLVQAISSYLGHHMTPNIPSCHSCYCSPIHYQNQSLNDLFKSKSDLTVEYCNLTHSHMQTKCCCSVNHVQLCDPMDCGTPGFPVLHNFLKFAQTRVYWIGDAIQPSHPLSPPSPPALNLSQHQSLFQWAGSSHQVTKVLELQLQHQSFQWIFRVDFLWYWQIWSPCSPRDSPRVFSSTTVQKHQFLSTQPSLYSNSHIHTWLLEKP